MRHACDTFQERETNVTATTAVDLYQPGDQQQLWGRGDGGAAVQATCLFTRIEESSLVPAEFLTAQYLQKT